MITTLNAPHQPSAGVLPPAPHPAFRKLYVFYVVLSVLLMTPSLFAWVREPFEIQKHDFDFFFGFLSPANDPAAAQRWVVIGRVLHFALLAALGAVFYRMVVTCREEIEEMPVRRLAGFVAGILVLLSIGLPWMNPDVFYYLGEGWLDAHYGLDAFAYSISRVPGFQADPMFANIDPQLFRVVGNYGPLHQSLCATLAGLGGGNQRLALALLKISNLGFLVGSALLVVSLARGWKLPGKFLGFCYLCNPLVLVCFLSWVHNDVQQNFCALLALFWVHRGKPLPAGCSLGAAVCFKYVGVVLLPALLVYWVLAGRGEGLPWRPRIRASLLSLLGFVLVCCVAYLPYENAWAAAVTIYTTNWSPFRSSIYYPIMEVLTLFKAGAWLLPTRTALTLLYVGLGAWLTLRPLFRKDGELTPLGLVRLCFWLHTSYLLLCAPAVLEWYFSWSLGFALLLGAADRRYLRFFAVLFSFYLPLVIFTIYQAPAITRPANITLYLLFAGSLALAFRRPRAVQGEVAASIRVHPVPAQQGSPA